MQQLASLIIGVKHDVAAGVLERGSRLPASLGAFDQHGTAGGQQRFQFSVDSARKVVCFQSAQGSLTGGLACTSSRPSNG